MDDLNQKRVREQWDKAVKGSPFERTVRVAKAVIAVGVTALLFYLASQAYQFMPMFQQ